ncbi:MAG: dihydrolipoyl dehydrogenase [Syntrophomonadaceae bacterium]|nr:dihydrolipoyl dehydrogenase [Syntrophomonadaceae bacterium]
MKDLVIIGGGPGGYVAAIRAAQLGMDITLIERESLGGTCLNRGCIPTKTYQYNAKVLHAMRKCKESGITVGDIQFDIKQAKARKDAIVANLVTGIKKLLEQNRVEVLNGEAELINNRNVKVGERLINTRSILIASGSKPAGLPIEGTDIPGVLNSDEILELTYVPSRLVIIGGGVIGLEFASIFNLFGSAVTVIESESRLLNLLDGEISRRMMVYLKKAGIAVYTGTLVQQITAAENGLKIIARGKKDTLETEADIILLAAGRQPATDSLNLDRIGVELTERGFIKTDRHYQTNIQGIYAIGDVIGGKMLAHVASEEGIAAVEHMGGIDRSVAYASVPSCIFTFPEVASVGMSEEEAQEKNIEYKTGKFLFAANSKAVTMGETDGMVKVIADQDERIIGVHIIGPNASDLILEGTLLVKNHMGVSDLLDTIHPHPTLGEAVMEAVRDIRGEAIHLSPKRK